MSTILQEAFLSGDKRGLEACDVAAAVFELAEQGAIGVCVNRNQSVTLSLRPQPVSNLTKDQTALRNRLFFRKEVVTFREATRGSSQVSLKELDEILHSIFQDKRHRLITTFRWQFVVAMLVATCGLSLTALAIFWHTAILLISCMAFLAAGAAALFAFFTKEYPAPSSDGITPLSDESGISFLMWANSSNAKLLRRTLANWVYDPDVKRRRPTWWTTPGDWPGGHDQKLMQAFDVITDAISA